MASASVNAIRKWRHAGLALAILAAVQSRSPAVLAAAGVSSTSLSIDQVIEAPRWMYDSKLKIKGPPLIQVMVEAKKALVAKDRARCLEALRKAFSLGKSLGPWLAVSQLQCAALRDKNGRAGVEALAQAVAKAENQPKWLLFGPHVQALRQSYTAALLALADEQLRSDRRSAWNTLDKLQQVRSWLTSEERASTYRWAGELAFIEQNLAAASDFLLRSLNEKENSEVRARVESIRTSLLGKKGEGGASGAGGKRASSAPSQAAAGGTNGKGGLPLGASSPSAASPTQIEDLEMSDAEREIYTRMSRAYGSQDYLSAIEDGVELMRKFPGSRRAIETSDKVLEIYLSLAGRNEDKFRHVRETAVKEMQKVDAGRMARWAMSAYARCNYQDSLLLADKAYAKFDGHPDSTKMALLAGKSAYAIGGYEDARKYFETVLLQHDGTTESAEATFRLGLLEFRQKHYPAAAARFERLLALSQGKDFEYRALYWQWRAQQKMDAEKSKAFAQPLIGKYPLTYYGLRARAETNGGVLQLPDKPLTVRTEMRLLEGERLAWERFTVLLKAGWFKEAEKELDVLPEPQGSDDRLVRAKLWALTLRYDNAIQLVNKVFDQTPEYFQSGALKIVFPQEYAQYIGREGKGAGLTSNWIRSLIRQESSFRPDVKSPANALGVMQVLPGTGAEIARDLKMKDFVSGDSLLIPEVNIKIGSAYLARLVRSFSGNIPLSLAAYNAGPTRLRRWLNARKDLSPLEAVVSSTPEVEIWMDEIPWDETSSYVRSILRNWLIYQLLDESKLTLNEPIWMDAKTSAR